MIPERKAALTRRAGIFIKWLQRGHYISPISEDVDLSRVITIINETLDRTFGDDAASWKPFNDRFMGARARLDVLEGTEDEHRENYQLSHAEVVATLEDYVRLIDSLDDN